MYDGIFYRQSKEHELFTHVTNHLIGGHLEDVEMDGLGERSGFSDEDNISFLN